MRLLFFSSDPSELQLASRELTQAGMACEVRNGGKRGEEGELWIVNDQDAYRAVSLCALLGVGFSRRRGAREVPEPHHSEKDD